METNVLGLKRSPLYIALSLLAAPCGVQAQSCTDAQARFDAALAREDFRTAVKIEAEIGPSPICGGMLTNFRKKRASLEVAAAEALRADPRRQGDREALLTEADEPNLLWTAAYSVGDLYMGQKHYEKAADAFERAITIAGDKDLTAFPPEEKDWKELYDLAYEAKALAAGFVTVHNRAGNVGGSLGSFRPISIKAIPLPVRFDTGSDQLTPDGEKYAGELAKAIIQQNPDSVILEGHTDDRGGDGYNNELSRKRVERVAAFLKSQGVKAKIRTEGKGKREPYKPSNAAQLSQEELWALNRRVVWRHAN
jgi:outer membrane protein OmpA-like peptidoglycan-associated protein